MRLQIETIGSGEPVLLLHGVAGSSRTYGWLALDGCAVTRFDFRGHGASARAPGTYRLEHYVADAVAVLEGLGTPAALAGHSLGGVVAWTVAQTRPELVTRAFLEDPPLYMGEPDEHARNPAIPTFHELRAVAAGMQAGSVDEAAAAAGMAQQALPSGRLAGDVLTDDALAARAYALTHLDVEVLDRVTDGSVLAGTDTTSPVDVPVFILAADDAPAFSTAHEQRLAATHPSVEVARLTGASHSIHDERAHRDEYLARLTAFLKGRARVRS
jgi:pimeloyl-ACP methyl ester carboxylesterase